VGLAFEDRKLVPQGQDLNQRPEGPRRDEGRHCTILIKFWKNLEISAATEAACDSYHDWRISRVQQGTGNRAIDRELNTLNNACRYAKRRGLIGVNPLADRPRYQSSKSVRHCREFMPGSADELHACAGTLMDPVLSKNSCFRLELTRIRRSTEV
jgi:hypothetical protein